MAQLLPGTNAQAVQQAAQRLKEGGLVVLPTETVYGLGADGLNPAAVGKIFQAKGRPADHPLILHVADLASARRLAADWPPAADALATACWPGPLTLVVQRAPAVPDAVTGGQDSVAIRIPAHPVALRLLRAFQTLGSGVVAAPSANRYGRLSPVRAADVRQGLDGFLEPEDLILDGGFCSLGLESTIVDVRDRPRILRPGGYGRSHLDHILQKAGLTGLQNAAEAAPGAPRVSGDRLAHYAPSMPLLLVADSEQADAVLQAAVALRDQRGAFVPPSTEPKNWMLWSFHHHRALPDSWLQQMAPRTSEAFGRILYAQLHDWQQEHLEAVVLQAPPDTPGWEAVWDRLRRAVVGSGQPVDDEA